VDILLSKDSILRLISMSYGGAPNRQERHESQARLNDGRWLQGHAFFERIDSTTVKLAFEPISKQQDGSYWISEQAAAGKILPAHINVYRADMLDKASFSNSSRDACGPAITKILLGILYKIHGGTVISSPAFDPFRKSLMGTLDEHIEIKWLDFDTLKSMLPFGTKDKPDAKGDMDNYSHIVWAGCHDGETLVGGVCLHKSAIAEIKIRKFGQVLPGQLFFVPTPQSTVNGTMKKEN
jgi:hypothetical protein